jgi:Chaperone of endosialidase
MNPLIQLKKATPLFLVVLACFGLSPMAQALLPPPPPDGGYPGQNTAEGDGALFDLTTGVENTAVGYHALIRTTTGDDNTATGSGALNSNTTGSNNTANGVQALFFNTRGSLNTATGTEALFNNTTALFNTAMGYRALFSNTGLSNTANGYQALFRNTIGGFNIALGHQAGMNLTTGSNNIDIGNAGVAGDSNKIRIGKQGTHNGTFIAGISGVAVMGSQVVVNANGRLGVAASSARFKEAIKLMDKASEAIHALKPVTFRYQKGIDPQGIPQFGLVAEDVEKVNRDLVVRDKEGKPYTVRYEAVNAMLLNEFLKEHRKNEEQEATIARQQKQIEAFTAGLQKVSAQLEASKSAPQIVNNR